MSQRTQMRLHAITGSLTAIHNESTASIAALPANIAAENLLDVLGEFAGAIKRIHGSAHFTNQEAGKFEHATSQFIGVLSASSDLKVGGVVEIDALGGVATSGSIIHIGQDGVLRTDANLKWDGATLTVNGALEASDGILFSELTEGQVVFVDAAGNLTSSGDFNMSYAGGDVGISGSLKVGGGYGAALGIDLKENGDIDMDGRLLVDGNALVSGSLAVGGNDFTVDTAGNVFAAGTLDVDGQATFGSANVEDLVDTHVVFAGASGELTGSSKMTHVDGVLTVSGSTFSKDVTVAQDLTVTRDMSAVSGSFTGDLTVQGDLFINGTTTTVNSTVVTVDDKAIELGATASPSDMTADGGGIILKGSTDKTILWSNTSGAWEMNDDLLPSADNSYDLGADAKRWQDLYLEGAADIDGNADVAGTLTIGGAATFNGLVDVNAGMSASFIKIDGATAQRLYIVDATGSMKDEAKLRFDGSELLVDAHLEVSGAADLKSTLAVALDADLNGNLDVALASDLHGAVHMYDTLRVDAAADFKSSMLVTGSVDMLSTVHAVGNMTLDAQLDVAGESFFANHINLDKAADDQSILKTGGDLYMSASVDLRLHGGQSMKFLDQYGASAALNVGDWADAEGIKLSSNAQEWIDFQDTFGVGKSIIGALVGGGAGGKFVEEVTYSGTIVSASLLVAPDAGAQLFSAKWPTIVEPRVLKTDVFVNGQLMVSGSGMDYTVAANGDVTFSFGLVPDDIVVVKVG